MVYEVVANRELFSEADWQRLRPFLHIPVDASVTYHLSQLEPSFPGVWVCTAPLNFWTGSVLSLT